MLQLLPEYVDIESPPPAAEHEVIGLITLEDCLEELLQEEILDEQDLTRENNQEESETQTLCAGPCLESVSRARSLHSIVSLVHPAEIRA